MTIDEAIELLNESKDEDVQMTIRRCERECAWGMENNGRRKNG